MPWALAAERVGGRAGEGPKTVQLGLISLEITIRIIRNHNNVVKTIVPPIFDGLYNPFLVNLGMAYVCFNHINDDKNLE